MDPVAPLILTLTLDESAFAFFDERRRRYFPPERNVLPAHLTLFHHLPGEHLDAILKDLEAYASDQPPFTLDVTGLHSLGRGVAYAVLSPELTRLRQRLARAWDAWLRPQDRNKHRPHVTVQNKVDPETAKTLLAELAGAFKPFTAQGTGLDLWWYRGGPWERIQAFSFAAG